MKNAHSNDILQVNKIIQDELSIGILFYDCWYFISWCVNVHIDSIDDVPIIPIVNIQYS